MTNIETVKQAAREAKQMTNDQAAYEGVKSIAASTSVNENDVVGFANGVIDMLERDGADEYLGDTTALDEKVAIITAYVDAYAREQREIAMRLMAHPDEMRDLCNHVYALLVAREA